MTKVKAALLLLALASLSSWGCDPSAQAGQDSASPPPTDQKQAEAPAARVDVWPVKPGPLSERLTVRGRVEPREDVTLSAEAGGRLQELRFDVGDQIKAGDVIARVDVAIMRAQRDQAVAGLAFAKKTHARLSALKAEELATAQQADEAETQVKSVAANIRAADVAISKSTVRSPLAGQVTHKLASAGEYVGPGTPLLRVVDLAKVRVVAQVPELNVASLKVGMPVEVRVPALGRTFPTTIQHVVPVADPVTHTYTLRLELDNADGALLPGMATVVEVVLAKRDAVIAVPQDLVVESSSGKAIFVVEKDLAVRRPVALGAVDAEKVEILSGLSAGEQLVVHGQRELADGQRVKIVTSHPELERAL